MKSNVVELFPLSDERKVELETLVDAAFAKLKPEIDAMYEARFQSFVQTLDTIEESYAK
jgi:hypothetical protein